MASNRTIMLYPYSTDKFIDVYINIRAFTIAMDSIVGIGILGNIIMFILLFNKTLRKYSFAVFLQYLAVFDTAFLVCYATELNIVEFHSLRTVIKSLYHGKIACYFWSGIYTTSRTAAPWLLVGLGIDRLIAVRDTAYRPNGFSRIKAHLICIFIFILSAVACFTHVICNANTACFIKCSLCKSYLTNYYEAVISGIVINTQIPVVAILCLIVCIIRSIKQAMRRAKPERVSRMTVALVAVIFVSFLALLPIAILRIVQWIVASCCMEIWFGEAMAIAGHVCIAIMVWNFALNFYIMFVFSRLFRHILCSCSLNSNQHGMQENEDVPLTGNYRDSTKSW